MPHWATLHVSSTPRSLSGIPPRLAMLAALSLAIGGVHTRQIPAAPVEPDNAASRRFASLLAPDRLNHAAVSNEEETMRLGDPKTGFDVELFPRFDKVLDVAGVPFLLQRNAVGADNYVPDGQSFAIPSGGRRLYLLAVRVHGGGRSRVAFDTPDGELFADFFVNDWCETDRFENREAVRMSHRIFEGRLDPIDCRLWALSLDLPNGATAARFAADLDLHLFSLVADQGDLPLWETRFQFDDANRIPPLSQPLPAPAPVSENDWPIGFVAHWINRGLENYEKSGATSVLMNLFVWRMRDRERQWVDFAAPEKWLAHLYERGLKAAVILDTSIHHTDISWRSAITRELGENVLGPSGEPARFSSPWSPRYREMVAQYVKDLTGWIATHDTARRVTTYVNGAEVFWPGLLDYGPLARKAFREWLLEEYGSLDALNERWGAEFKSVDEIDPVPFYQVGRSDLSRRSFAYPDWVDEAWTIDLAAHIHKGMRYRVSADVRADVHQDGQVFLEVVWRNKDAVVRIDIAGCANHTYGKWKHLEGGIEPPDAFDAVSIQLTQQTTGRTEWRNPKLIPEHGDASLIPVPTRDNVAVVGASAPPPNPVWVGAHYGQADIEQSVRTDDLPDAAPGGVILCMDAPAKTPRHGRDSAAWYDFTTFSMETYARLMNDWALHIKRCDPTRKVMHYLGFTLGALGQWDDSFLTQRADIFLANSADADINGIQLCAAKGNFHYTTFVVDLARKYKKPIVATDLQDFTHGVYIGFNAMNRTTLAAIAHGCRGLYYYCWHGTPDYNWLDAWTLDETRRMIRNAEQTLEFLGDAILETDTAFVAPILAYCEADPGGMKNDMRENMGLYTLVAKLGYCPEVYTIYELAQSNPDLGRFARIFLPDCLYINNAAWKTLARYVENGGTLILTGRPPRYDETGRPLEQPLLPRNLTVIERGESGAKRIFTRKALAASGLDPRFAEFGLPGDATLVDDAGAWAGITRRRHGRGTLIFTGGMDGKGYLGPMRRYRVAGNTPPLFIPDEGLLRPEGAIVLEALRETIIRQEKDGRDKNGDNSRAAAEAAVANNGESRVTASARLDPPDPSIEYAVYRHGDGEYRVVLIHTAPGMRHGGVLALRASSEQEKAAAKTQTDSDENTGRDAGAVTDTGADSVVPPKQPASPEVLADFEPRVVKVGPIQDGELRIPLPAFADCCLVRW